MGSCNNGDRHSKVQTSRGLKDRRIRLSSEMAIKLYDIHDRLGFNQPTESVEWLLQKAQPAINNLSQTQFVELEENIESSSFTHHSNQQSLEDHKMQRGVSGSGPWRKHKESDREKVERRAKARERARQRTKQKLNINMELQDSTSSFPDATMLRTESSPPQDESNVSAFLQSPAREDTSTQYVCSSSDTLSPLLSGFAFPSPNYDNAFVFEDDFYI